MSNKYILVCLLRIIQHVTKNKIKVKLVNRLSKTTGLQIISKCWPDIISLNYLILFQGNLAGCRLAVVKEAFKKADKTGDGVITCNDLKR